MTLWKVDRVFLIPVTLIYASSQFEMLTTALCDGSYAGIFLEISALCRTQTATPAFIRIDGLNVELTGGKTASNSRTHCRSRQNHTKLVTPARTRGARSRIS